MQNIAGTNRRYRQLTEIEWTRAIALFERGEYHAKRLADLFGVCDRTMRTGLKARGAVKACRVHEIRNELCAMVFEFRRINKIRTDAELRKFARLFETYLGETFEPLDLSEWANMNPMEGYEDLALDLSLTDCGRSPQRRQQLNFERQGVANSTQGV